MERVCIMKKSVLFDDMNHCILCGSESVQIHHIFFGTANRKLSDDDGYIAPLCQKHHTGKDGVHFNRPFDLTLKEMAQRHFEETHDRQAFIRRYGKSYL